MWSPHARVPVVSFRPSVSFHKPHGSQRTVRTPKSLWRNVLRTTHPIVFLSYLAWRACSNKQGGQFTFSPHSGIHPFPLRCCSQRSSLFPATPLPPFVGVAPPASLWPPAPPDRRSPRDRSARPDDPSAGWRSRSPGTRTPVDTVAAPPPPCSHLRPTSRAAPLVSACRITVASLIIVRFATCTLPLTPPRHTHMYETPFTLARLITCSGVSCLMIGFADGNSKISCTSSANRPITFFPGVSRRDGSFSSRSRFTTCSPYWMPCRTMSEKASVP